MGRHWPVPRTAFPPACFRRAAFTPFHRPLGKHAREMLNASRRRTLKRPEGRARVPGRGLVYRDERFPTGVVTPTVVEPPGRLRKEPARKGGRQTFDRRNTNGQ